ncbi:hypothetical protein GA354_08935 [Salmonella enterica]|nr:hypothetical protein [Salmonella enterica]EDF4848596.1 hypothetical protein [Salmonella enterica]
MFCRDADLFTQQKRASPRDGLITQSTRKAVTAGALFCFVEKPTGGGNRHLEGLTMNDDRSARLSGRTGCRRVHEQNRGSAEYCRIRRSE